MTSPAEPTLVDGIDVDAVAAAVRGCPAVADLDGGRIGGAVTYLPGRRVPGIRIGEDRIEVQVCGVWGQPVSVIAQQIRDALATLSGGKVVDVMLTDITEPGQAVSPAGSATPSALEGGSVEGWTKPSASGVPSGGSSSGAIIPTAAETRPNS